ncbi:M20/M25/M40 family metallo-hydrolase [Parasphingopyxis lamellibrachiae]|uniref:Acetylornithine deacetylase/succinyl-diaminopimelate desuccinylase-like protein n=1 Tax=Parasphingopyxis lamellibrachiae TaxID=680125 RepID=A0A3D9FCM7_9SPHN|nr:M20/M25/M40 family metallo-hydrolase [Parasphingopyxis lamellibrachiae]RED15549.1 acetylornithine deacetylase/succinyl-diaminopimelate desuccinylase-like protein [Parasphingopyxis lamellibrachiae]
MKTCFIACAGLLALPLTPLSAFQDEAAPIMATYQSQIANLREDARMAAAFVHIAAGHDEHLQNLITLTEVPAPPFGEGARAAVFADMMRATGFGEVTIDDAGNVVAHRPGAAATHSVMMVAHLDTVFPAETDVTVQVEGNRYTAPGIGDNTRGAVMLLQIASAIAAADIRTQGDIILVGNVGEEGLGDLRGVRHLFRDAANRPDSFIAIDGGDDARLVTRAVGSTRFRVTLNGPGGHSWGDFGDANPHHASARAITRFVNAARPITQDGPRASYNIGRTGGGTSVNSIPFESWFEVDMRSGDPARLEALVAVFQQAMAEGLEAENAVRGDSDPLTMTIEPIGSRPAGESDPALPLVQRARALLEADGITPVLTASSTDSNIPISLGIPAITISRCGTSARAHSLDEYWEDDGTVPACTMRGLALLIAEAELAGD